MSGWDGDQGHDAGHDEWAGRLRQSLRREAEQVAVPDRLAAVRAAARRAEAPRRTWLVAAAAALLLVAGGGLVWQLAGSGGGVASSGAAPMAQDQAAGKAGGERAGAAAPAAPGTIEATDAAASPPPARATGAAPVREVSGATIGFASPTGNLVCYLDGAEAVCQILSTPAWERAVSRPCPVIGGGTTSFRHDQGSVTLGSGGAALVCGTQGLPQLDLAARDASTGWYDGRRDASVTTGYGTVPVLPYGGVATTTGGVRCAMSEAGVRCDDPSGSAFVLSAEQVSLAGPSGSGRVTVRYVAVTGTGAFVTPSGGIWCLVDGGSGAACEVAQPTYRPPAKPASCELDWGHRISVDASGAGFACTGDTFVESAATGTASTSWFDGSFGGTVGLANGQPGAVLGYGSTLTAGAYTCAVETTGVTCTDRSGRGFAVARQTFSILP